MPLGRSKFSLGAIFDFVNRGHRSLRQADSDVKSFHKSLSAAISDAKVFGLSAPKAAAAGAALVAAGTAGAIGLKRLSDSAVPLEAAITQVNTLLSDQDQAILTTRKQMEAYTKIATRFGISSEEAARAGFQVVSASVKASEAIDVLTVASKAATAGNADLFATVDGLTSVMNAYGNEALGVASQTAAATKVADLFFQTNRLGKTTVEELSRSLGQVAPVAASLGVPFEDISAALATMTAQGLNTRRSTTFLAQALSNILKPTDDARKAAEALGVAFDAKALDRGLLPFLEGIAAAAGDDTQALAKLFGSVEAFKAITILTSATGAQKFAESLDAMTDAAGSVDTALGKVTNTADLQRKRLRAGTQSLAQAIGFELLPANKSLTEVLADTVESMTDWVKRNPGVVKAVLATAAALSGLAVAVGGSLLAGAAVAAWGALWPIVGAAVTTAFGAVVTAAWPFLAAVTALAVAGGVLVAKWDRVKAGFDRAGFGPAFRELGTAARELGGALLEAFGATSGTDLFGDLIESGSFLLGSVIVPLVKQLTKFIELLTSISSKESAIASAGLGGLASFLPGGSHLGIGQTVQAARTFANPALAGAGAGGGQVEVGGTAHVRVDVHTDGKKTAQQVAELQLEAAERVGPVSNEQRSSVVDGIPIVSPPQ